MFLTRSALFASPLGQRVAFYSMTGRETLSQPFTYEVDLLSAEDTLDLSELLGQASTVVLERTDGSLRQFTGFVTSSPWSVRSATSLAIGPRCGRGCGSSGRRATVASSKK